MGGWPAVALPEEAEGLDRALELFPQLRQSLLASYDDCPLSALFELRYANGWSTHPQARGTIMHRAYAEVLRTLVSTRESHIPVAEALEILIETCQQRGVPLEDRVRVPLRERRVMRTEMIKFAHENAFSYEAIIDVERRLYATVSYTDDDGLPRERVLTGQLDALIADGEDGAVVLDWKSSWSLPPQRMKRLEEGETEYEDAGANVSWEGYFQQRFYGWLVMMTYPSVERVRLREFYPRKGKAREATLRRVDLEHVERELADLAREFDLSVAAGTRDAGTLRAGDAWRPSPGVHCSYCSAASRCPIEAEARGVGAITSLEMARRYAAEYRVADRVREGRWEALKVWCRVNGDVPLKGGKGRSVMGFRERTEQTRYGPRVKSVFGVYPEDTSDRGSHPADLQLEEALKASAQETEALRQVT